ncbi:MAG TPA: TonB-dependent receptor [Steroidobacteraceae bacterium]|nr:TonB-dependent receptor [Steroidobacteraceae bacterium]
MTVSVSKSVQLAVKRALTAGAVAICGAASLSAYAQQAPASGGSSSQVGLLQAADHDSKKIQPAQAKSHEPKKVRLAQASTGSDGSDEIRVAQATAGSNPTSPAPLQEVVITGSLIARTSIETPNPVQVLSAKDLVQSGYTDVSTVLKSISANGASTLSQSFSGAFASGGSGVSLRGLTVGDTLVLIDGERTVPYPLLDDNQRSFVDLSSIPFTAIESVQVDKNGASAVYGSDAIAGVVNVLLKKQYQGFTVSAEAGTSQRGDGTLEHLGFIGGRGDLDSDGYNWYVSGEVRHQDQILASKRSGLWDDLDLTPWGGVYGTAVADNGASTVVNPFFPYPQSTTGYLIDPATGNIVNYLPGCNAQQAALNKCLATDPGAQLQPPTTRVDLLAKFTRKLNDDWTLGVQASWFESSSQALAGYANYTAPNADPLGGISETVFGPGLVYPNGQQLEVVPPSAQITPNLITIPSTNPMYPTACNPATDAEKCSWFGSPVAFQYAFPELGGASQQTNTYTYRLLANLDGKVGGWTIHTTGGAMYSKLDNTVTTSINWQNLQTALDNGYVFGSSSGTSQFAPDLIITPWSELDLLDVHGQHELFELPGGPLELAVGVQYFKEVHDERAPASVVAGLQAEPGGPVYVIGTQKDAAAFLELDGNPIKSLEIDAAGRFDDYKGIGSAVTPQIGVKFTPLRQIALRGTFGKGFRAPSAAEGGGSGELFGAGTYQDNVNANHQPGGLCPNPIPSGMIAGYGDYSSQCAVFVGGFQIANPHLQNVKSTTYTLGVILQPIHAISASVDYYNIKVQNDIVGGFEAGGLYNFIGQVRGAPTILSYCNTPAGCSSTSQEVNQLTSVGPVLENVYTYVNSGFTHTSGIDLDLQAHYDAGRFGRLTGELTWTHEITYQLLAFDSSVGAPVLFELAGTHGPEGVSGDTGNPKDRGTLQVSWAKGPLTVSPSVMFVGHFSITDPSAGINNCAAGLATVGRFLTGVTPQDQQFCTVRYFLETNLYGSYQMSSSLQVHAAVTNLFNKTPPVDVSTYGAGTYFYPYDPAMHQDGAVGRYFTVGFQYDFD